LHEPAGLGKLLVDSKTGFLLGRHGGLSAGKTGEGSVYPAA
jgi:hypothetical protein